MLTLTSFCNDSHLPDSLIRAVVRQVGGWQDFKEMADDVSSHGANGGFSGFIYYGDTVKFAAANKAAILEMAEQQSQDFGEPLYKMVGGFNCLKITEGEAAEAIHNPRSENRTKVMNALAWYALEEVCRAYVDCTEREPA